MHLYTPDMIESLNKNLSETNHFFGYTKREGNHLGFIDYEGKADKEHDEIFEEFKKIN